MRPHRRALLVAALFIAWAPLSAQTPSTIPEMWKAWCARCHAENGSGRPGNRPVAVEPMDFTDCKVATPEPDADWAVAIRSGGPAVGLSSEMPAFGDALTEQQIRGFVAYIRTFCGERGWPGGNLNFPRAIFTEKAFPENELIVLPMASHDDTAPWSARVVYERRAGRRTQFELSVPLRSSEMFQGLGDIAVAAKHVIAASDARGAILSGGLEVVFPTGSASRGLGTGTAVFEPYLAAGLSRFDMYLQAQLKYEIAARGGDRALVYNAYMGRDLSDRPNTWTIGAEINGEDGALAFTPQIRKGLTATGAVAAAFGARLPLNRRREQEMQWIGYLLWEYLEPVRAAR
ncbi:MAG: c-type cytochrome [Acidobacteriota bacterium]|nr:c-type cytochrome [Acidobacteriota bacterium]